MARTDDRESRLDTPRQLGRRLRSGNKGSAEDTFGVFAENFARFMGTSKFLLWMTVFIVVWISFNVIAVKALRFDAFPFILLNLVFSTQASYAAPLILLAQNRQEDRDRVVAEQDRQVATSARADMEFLAREMASLRMALGEVATRDFVRSELRALLADLDDRDQEQAKPEG